MMRRFRAVAVAVVVLSSMSLAFTGCSITRSSSQSSSEKEVVPPDTGENTGTVVRPPAVDPTSEIQKQMQTVYFDFDKSNIRADQANAIEKNAEVLKAHAEVSILVEGHCDERGTLEYNMALGQRRATTVREFLISRGVDAKRVTIVSKGEEEPVDAGHAEAAWAKNRRAEFKVTK